MSRPTYRLEISGQAASQDLMGRIVDITVKETDGHKSDTLEFKIDDKGNNVEPPSKGQIVKVWLGFRHNGLVYKGSYKIDEVKWNSDDDGDWWGVEAKGTDMRKKLKEQKTRAHDKKNQKVRDVLQTVASDHGLDLAVSDELGNISLPYFPQTEQSDMDMVNQLGVRYDAVASFKDGKLMFTKRGQGKGASGANMSPLVFVKGDFKEIEATMGDRPEHSTSTAHYQDKKKRRRGTVKDQGQNVDTSDSEDVSFTHRRLYPDKDTAQRAAQSSRKRLNRQAKEIDCDTPGSPEVTSGSPIILMYVRDGVDGEYTATKVTHKWSHDKAETNFEAEARDEDSEGDDDSQKSAKKKAKDRTQQQTGGGARPRLETD